VLALMARSYCIDPTRIFAVGHSLGAWFLNSLGCDRGDTLRDIATLAGGISRSVCRGAVAALIVHNPKDRLVDFRHGLEARDRFRAQNSLEGGGRSLALEGFACRRYGDAAAANPVVCCPHSRDRTRSGRYYPHTSLPAAATAATAPSASRTPQD
jgi:polyhydroxybutyrate depolymerase